MKTAIKISEAKHPEGTLSKYQHVDGIVSMGLMTLDGQMTDFDTEEKAMSIGKEGTFPIYCALKLFIETQRNKPPKICTTVLAQVSLILEAIKYYMVKRHQYNVVEHFV